MLNLEAKFYSPEEINEILKKYGTRTLDANSCCDIFAYGNSILKKNLYQKKGVVSKPNEAEDDGLENESIVCDIFACQKQFKDISSFENHWRLSHYFICKICRKNLPSNHLLDLHIQESHDSFFAVQKETKPMYSCFLEECPEKFQNPAQRKDHCITVHGFRHDFKFEKPTLSPKKNKNEEKMDTTEESNPKKPPTHFQFGHGTQKTFKFQQKHKPKKDAFEEMAVDLKKDLPDV